MPEQMLFEDDEDPTARLLRRRVCWTVVDEDRKARLEGSEAFLSLTVLRLSSGGGVGAHIPLVAMHREEYQQPLFSSNKLTGLARVEGSTVQWTLNFDTGGSAAFATVFFRAVRAARSGGATNSASMQASAATAVAGEDETCVWAEVVPVDGSADGNLPTATAVRTGLYQRSTGA